MAEAIEIERDVARLYKMAGIDPCLPTSLADLLMALAETCVDGLTSIRFVPANDGPSSRLRIQRINTAWAYEIEIAQVSVTAATAWRLAHETGEWRVHWLDAAPQNDTLRERLANNWAGALLVPAPALAIAWDCWGFDLPTLAAQFGTTQRVVALRLGEALGHGIAVIDSRAEPLFGRPWIQRRGWLAEANVSDFALKRLAWLPPEARWPWRVATLKQGVRVLYREGEK